MLIIEPVRPADRDSALALLVGRATTGSALTSGGKDAHLDQTASGFSALLSGDQARQCNLWWAKGPHGPQAAAMTVRSPGRTAMIFHSRPAGADEVGILARLLDELTEVTVTKEVAFVQALLPPGAEAEAAFVRAGYTHLAQLIYMQRPLTDLPGEEFAAGLEWETFSPGREGQLAEIIADTYVDSADCPGLLKVRRIEDVIAGHKAAGIFRPENWWLPTWRNECVGCVLVNESPGRDGTAEVAYLGVRPAWRRRGLGRAMIRHALTRMELLSLKKMSLAVDAANAPALRLYQQEGFRRTDRREVFIRLAGKPKHDKI